ncbi:MAG: hypothetical protein MUF24_06995 [Chitinophagaceae bacterium]|jgi:hypothetical protein|nr:hypothetical protein [Chitinophagaceae bacterium]
MKTLIKASCTIIVALVSALPSVFAQAEADTIKQTVLAYFKTIETFDMKASVEYLHPAIFDLVPKNNMIEMLEQSFKDPEVRVKMDSAEILKVSPILEDNNIKYGLVNYSFLMHMTMMDGEKPLTNTNDKSALMVTYNIIKGKYGDKKVRLESAKGTIHVLSETSLFAIKAPEFDGWKFLENKENMTRVFDGIIPQNILIQLLKK